MKAKIAIFCLGLFMLWNIFFDFNHFLHSYEFPSLWTIVNSKKFQPWEQLLLTLNGLAGFTNIIGFSIYGIFALAWDYVGAMQLTFFVFYLVQFVGYNLLKRHFTEQKILVTKITNAICGFLLL